MSITIQYQGEELKVDLPITSVITTTDLAITITQLVDAAILGSKLSNHITRFKFYPVENKYFRILHDSTEDIKLKIKIGNKTIYTDFDSELSIEAINKMLEGVNHPPLLELLSERELLEGDPGPEGPDGEPGPRGPKGKPGPRGQSIANPNLIKPNKSKPVRKTYKRSAKRY